MRRITRYRLLLAAGYLGGAVLLVACVAVIMAVGGVWGPGWMNELWDWISG